MNIYIKRTINVQKQPHFLIRLSYNKNKIVYSQSSASDAVVLISVIKLLKMSQARYKVVPCSTKIGNFYKLYVI